MGRTYYRELKPSRVATSKEVLDSIFVYAKHSHPEINNLLDLFDAGRKDYRTSFIRKLATYFLIYYSAETKFTNIANLLGKKGRNSISQYVRDFNYFLEIKDRKSIEAFTTIKLLIEGAKTPGEQIYINWLKSGKSAYEYLTKEYEDISK
jgi:hypothetical protein